MTQENLIERLMAENEEFRRLRSEHQDYERELDALKVTLLALGGSALADQRAQEAEADGQGPHGGDHAEQPLRRHRLSAADPSPAAPSA